MYDVKFGDTKNSCYTEKNEGTDNVYNGDMSTISKEELKAILELHESRIDNRISTISSEFHEMLALHSERQKTVDERDKRIDRLMEESRKNEESALSLKSTMVTTIILSSLTIIATMFGLYFASQQSSIGIAQIVAQVYQQGQSSVSQDRTQKPTAEGAS
jgi:uncharacterized protein (DUF1015 family)